MNTINLTGGCLLPNEEIIIEDGLKMMADIKEGDMVLSHDGQYHAVERVWNFEKPTYYVSLSNGDHIECSNTHRFLINKTKIDRESSWKTAEELHDGDEIISMSTINIDPNEKIKYNKVKIARIFKSGINNPVIDLTVADTHTYISANGIVNHNSDVNSL